MDPADAIMTCSRVFGLSRSHPAWWPAHSPRNHSKESPASVSDMHRSPAQICLELVFLGFLPRWLRSRGASTCAQRTMTRRRGTVARRKSVLGMLRLRGMLDMLEMLRNELATCWICGSSDAGASRPLTAHHISVSNPHKLNY